MNIQSILLLLAILLGFFAALRGSRKGASHSCCGDCKKCGSKCRK